MKVYRYEDRLFKVGDVITPDLIKEPVLTPENIAVETIISKLDPKLAKIRSRALYTWLSRELFESFIELHKRGVSILKNKNFYELQISSQDILFESDLNYYTLAMEHFDNVGL